MSRLSDRSDRHHKAPESSKRPFGLAILGLCSACLSLSAQSENHTTRVEVASDGWALTGDLVIPQTDRAVPVVLLLNQAAGDRRVYERLADQLLTRGIASLRLDLRGHGESVNLGRFVPGEQPRSPMIWDAERDVWAAHQFLAAYPGLDGDRLGMVGASYSGEEMAESGRLFEYARAYVALSPGSFSEASIRGIDTSGVPWLVVVANRERFLQEITTSVRTASDSVLLEIVPGTGHATNLLDMHPFLSERLAVWFSHYLLGPNR